MAGTFQVGNQICSDKKEFLDMLTSLLTSNDFVSAKANETPCNAANTLEAKIEQFIDSKAKLSLEIKYVSSYSGELTTKFFLYQPN
ncbi:hypothetical protein H4219_004710 [Mycoemilia scoparia]|uniref:Uncharacterized protein n=1 Tax=Mycoemilia scoparia TaxID=417184 RepID=A0A9W8DL27_9FUNG|nr:hypothetical protein H4219_004710 [Mycoemilia scoparia]